MKKATERFDQEMESIRRIVNGYLSTDPILSDFVLDSISIKRKGKEKSQIDLTSEDAEGREDKSSKRTKSNFDLPMSRCCVRANGEMYIRNAPGPCPKDEKECSG